MSGDTLGLSLEPLDVLFFRGGRPFGASIRATSGLPLPQTLAGALQTALLNHHGCDFGRLASVMAANGSFGVAVEQACQSAPWIGQVHLRGPWLALAPDANDPEEKVAVDILYPMPAILRESKYDSDGPTISRLVPRAEDLPGWRARRPGMRPLWQQSDQPTEAKAGYVNQAGLRAFLAGGVPSDEDIYSDEDLFSLDHRTGIAINPDALSVEESMIYGASFLSLRPTYSARAVDETRCLAPVVLYAELTLPAGAQTDAFADETVITLGGEGRRVRASLATCKSEKSLEHATSDRREGKPLLLLTTPGIFEAGWMPKYLEDAIIAAAVPGHVAVSGWDLAKGGPKPTRFAAPAGSVYFLDSPVVDLPEALSDDPEDRRQAWGCYVEGVWSDE